MTHKKLPIKRAINIFINDRISTRYIDTGVFKKIIDLFNKEGYLFKFDKKLKMIYLESFNNKKE